MQLLFAYVLLLSVAGVLGWRAVSLRGLPDIGEPFDVDAFTTVRVPDEANAYVLYRQASAQFKNMSIPHTIRSPRRMRDANKDQTSITSAVPAWIDENRVAIDLFLEAADRPHAQVGLRAHAGDESFLPRGPNMTLLGRLVLLEGSRLQEAGDLKGAWRRYRAVARASRHIAMLGVKEATVEADFLQRTAQSHILGWVEEPGQTNSVLRRAIGDMEECALMTPPASLFVENEYYLLREGLLRPEALSRWRAGEHDEPEQWWRNSTFLVRAKHFFNREPERSLRVLRLIVAGQLAQCDCPAAMQARVLFPEYPIYAANGNTPPGLRSVSPERLAKWARSSSLFRLPLFEVRWSWPEQERNAFAAMSLEMALRCFELDHGAPAQKYADLLGSYVASLPEGVRPEEPLPSSEDDARPK